MEIIQEKLYDKDISQNVAVLKRDLKGHIQTL
jgi:hypothetical protein